MIERVVDESKEGQYFREKDRGLESCHFFLPCPVFLTSFRSPRRVPLSFLSPVVSSIKHLAKVEMEKVEKERSGDEKYPND